MSKDGDVSPGVNNNPGGTAPGAVSADSVDFIVRFVANAQQHYGFDSKEYEAGQYDRTEIQDTEYPIAWKSVETGRQDNVNAITDEDSFPAAIGFKTNSGENISQPAGSENEKQVVVTGKIAGGSESLTAYVKIQGEGDEQEQEIEVGKLTIVTYDKVREKVFIVPVNNAVAPQISAELNRIYGQAVARWDVTIDEQFTIEQDYITGLDDGESGMLASFPQKMREFNRKFNRSRNIDKDAYYIFLVEGSGASRKGFMPFKRQFGFIYTDKLGSTPPATAIAHELGHGAFRLRHPQSEFGIAMTDNLMHNTNGTTLRKYQWQNVHNPQSMVGWFQEDAESEMAMPCLGIFDDCDDVLAILKGIKHRVDKKYEMLPVFKANSEKNRKEEYVGLYLAVDDIEYSKISIKNQISEDTNVDPKVYYDYHEKDGENYAGGGFMFKAAENSLFKVIVANEKDSATTQGKIEKLRKYLFGDLKATVEEKESSYPNEIVIHYKRKGRNQYRTWGEFTIVGTDYKGYILERPKGDNPTKLEDYKRHPGGTYNIGYSENSGGSAKFDNVTLYIVEHPAYKLHCGNRADQSDGCLLINDNSPQNDKYPDAYQSKEEDVNKPSEKRNDNPDRCGVANSYPPGGKNAHQHPSNPAKKLRDKVFEMEQNIKAKYKTEIISKKIIIDESEEKLE